MAVRPSFTSPLLALQSDERLAQLVRDGHEQAFAVLVKRHRPALVRRCERLLGGSRGEDAVQQALMNAHAALTAGTRVNTVGPWLHRVAQNSALNILRTLRDETPLDDERLVTVASPADRLEVSERLEMVLEAVRDLPESQRAALVLHEFEGRSHAEIGAALGVSEGAARQHLSRARAAVRSAATAVTPYPLLAGALGWGGAATGGAALVKITAGVAVIGGAVGGTVVATDLPDRIGGDDGRPAAEARAAASPTSTPLHRAATVTLPSQASAVARRRVASTPSRTGAAGRRRAESAKEDRGRSQDAGAGRNDRGAATSSRGGSERARERRAVRDAAKARARKRTRQAAARRKPQRTARTAPARRVRDETVRPERAQRPTGKPVAEPEVVAPPPEPGTTTTSTTPEG